MELFFFWIAFQSILRHQFHPPADSGLCYKNRKILKKMEMLLSEDLFVRRSKRGWQGGWEREACSRRAQGEQWGAKGVLVPQLCTAPGAEMAPCDSTVLPALRVNTEWSSAPVLLTEVISWDILGICQSGEWVPWFLLSTLPNTIRKLRFGFLQKLNKP